MFKMVYWAAIFVLIICGLYQIAIGIWAGSHFLETFGTWLKKRKKAREQKEPFAFLKYAPTDRPNRMLRLK